MPGKGLILAGTAEARRVCAGVSGYDVLASLAGRTERPLPLAVPVRTGGFGGDAGFQAALRQMAAVLDATHPFATVMSGRAARICAETGVPYLRLTRPPWPTEADWTHHATAQACAAALPRGARVFLSIGPGGLAPFLGRDLLIWCRRIDPAPDRPGVTWVVGPPGLEMSQEAASFRTLGITHLVTKNAGGARAKLDAARALGLAVHVIDRPPPPPGDATHDIDRAIAFVRAHASPLPDHRDG
ncbi:precorrin-6A/cobalt-precorrin-6A reductase [Jannaschia sp. M317]|uniref:precorrin-6A/cobalt-precorrin-6A reductase n=1 Tax=Jannaschia sp. M317 TaxID=2867011 RepID=UPI0021A8622C|nr:precorrin-6A/cobalt-precorrin-6A reductase [Jannaschia sp. M317]UWQ16575.1 precorrin-6A/cobalt-precorrin-6A reductase [Jannaschia sp. M317]